MKRSWLGFLVPALVLAHPAWAYVPPAGFVIRTMAQKKAGFKGLRIRSLVSAVEAGKPASLRFRENTVVDVQNGVIRSRALDESGRELFATERRLSAEDAHGSLGVEVNRLLFSPSGTNLTRDLVASGIPVPVEGVQPPDQKDYPTRLKRLKGTVAWVYSGKPAPGPGAARTPEFWVEKDTFLPLLLQTQSQAKEPASKEAWAEVHFEEYRFYRDFPYPRVLEFGQDGTIRIHAELADLQVNPDLAELRKPLVAGWTDAGNAAPQALRELIRSYYDQVH